MSARQQGSALPDVYEKADTAGYEVNAYWGTLLQIYSPTLQYERAAKTAEAEAQYDRTKLRRFLQGMGFQVDIASTEAEPPETFRAAEGALGVSLPKAASESRPPK